MNRLRATRLRLQGEVMAHAVGRDLLTRMDESRKMREKMRAELATLSYQQLRDLREALRTETLRGVTAEDVDAEMKARGTK